MIEKERFKLQEILDAGKSQSERNHMGQFATPFPLACDIIKSIKQIYSNKGDCASQCAIELLEPSIGTGVFYSAFLKVFGDNNIAAYGCEIDPYYGIPAKNIWQNYNLNIDICDFFEQINSEKRFSLIVSNPPYSRHHHINSDYKKKLQYLVKKHYGINISGLSGLYCYFLILSTLLLYPKALSTWLIPGEFMDVNYGSAIRRFLLKKVNLSRIHRFSPENVQFSDAMVSSVVVFFTNEQPNNEEVILSKGASVEKPESSIRVSKTLLDNTSKWSSLFSSAYPVCYSGPTLGDFFSVKRGLATGDNKFFIVQNDIICKYEIPTSFLVPILPGPRYIPHDIIHANSKGVPLLDTQQFLLQCSVPPTQLKITYPKLWKYIETGMEQKVDEGYLCQHRTPWYSIEKRKPAPFIVPYMGREGGRKIFRFILNQSQAVNTNVFLMLYPKNQFSSLFSNPDFATEIWKQLNAIPEDCLISSGRVYGGGLHKLEPKELLSVPAKCIEPFFPMERTKQGTFF